MADRVIPNYRIKRILEIEDHVPRMNKKALTALSKSLKIFLQEYAKDIHRHIVNTASSYPVKPKHIVNVSSDPRFIKYEFLTHARHIIEADENQMESINKIMKENKNKDSGDPRGEYMGWDQREESKKPNNFFGNCIVDVECNVNTSEKLTSSKMTLKRTAKSNQKNGDKRQKQSILTYFTPK